MSGIHGLKHIYGFASPDLTDNDSVRSHSERRPDKVAYRYFIGAFHICAARLKPYKILNIAQP